MKSQTDVITDEISKIIHELETTESKLNNDDEATRILASARERLEAVQKTMDLINLKTLTSTANINSNTDD
jgi:hypothetical protein